ncbi:unnamed protein product [Periconia digitata]|uniref:Uncharacterized protein n=1 Tax=Periconia digitata TaxID=1303443 RepID=A0A9W4XTK1_9PLEO|nr:unnamed protein product [Periconia digitata]
MRDPLLSVWSPVPEFLRPRAFAGWVLSTGRCHGFIQSFIHSLIDGGGRARSVAHGRRAALGVCSDEDGLLSWAVPSPKSSDREATCVGQRAGTPCAVAVQTNMSRCLAGADVGDTG